MLTAKLDREFKKDIDRDKISGKYKTQDFTRLKYAMQKLINEEILEDSFLAHQLIGEWQGYRECHIKPNWLVIYKVLKDEIRFARIGTHTQLFKKI